MNKDENGKIVNYTSQVYAGGEATGVNIKSGVIEIKTLQDDGSIKITYESDG